MEQKLTSPVMPVYRRAEIAFASGKGAYLFDDSGKPYLDFMSGVGVTALGHAHPVLVEALTRQASQLWHTSNLFRIARQEELAQLLVENTFADNVFFTNSGVEAWECGVKVVRKFFHHHGQPERNRIIIFEGGFHGRTISAISAVHPSRMSLGFAPLLDGFDLVELGDFEAVEKAITSRTAGICIEPIQGEGGIRVAEREFLQGLRRLADSKGLLLFLDEIFTGMGRTGYLFAYEQAGIVPDVMCIAKGLAGGFPIGACLATLKAAVGMTVGTHGSTFGGNPLASAVGKAALEIIRQPDFLARVRRAAQLLDGRLQSLAEDYPRIFTQVRGRGLMLGIRIGRLSCQEMIAELLARGLLVAPARENIIRLLPPLIVQDEQIDQAYSILQQTAASLG